MQIRKKRRHKIDPSSEPKKTIKVELDDVIAILNLYLLLAKVISTLHNI